MATIEVELGDINFPISKIAEYLNDEYVNGSNKTKELIRKCAPILFKDNKGAEIVSLIDTQKIDFLIENIDKITLEDLEGILK